MEQEKAPGGKKPLRINRRDFIRYAALGIAAAGTSTLVARTFMQFGERESGKVISLKLAMTEALVEMVDRSRVFHWAFEDLNNPAHLPQMPGPLIEAVEGDTVKLSLTNSLSGVHGFQIPGVSGLIGTGVEIAPGETRVLVFPAPEAGSYLYIDHLNAPVNRVLGLHGPMVVLPAAGNTPFSKPTPAVQKLFDDLGTTAHFPGEPWKPERSRIWLFNSVDPTFNAVAEKGERIDPVRFKETLLPLYLTINGLSGAYATHAHHIVPSGRIGQPHLIRIMNAGISTHSPHIHGNHVYVISSTEEGGAAGEVKRNGVARVEENVIFLDTVTVFPMERMCWLLPFRRPPDIPGDPSIPLRNLASVELSLTLGGVGQSPFQYPTHCHLELSQSAAGGNYPQGLVTNWQITGDLDGTDFPRSNPEEKGKTNDEYHGGRK